MVRTKVRVGVFDWGPAAGRMGVVVWLAIGGGSARADEAAFLNPLGAEWGTLGASNEVALAVASTTAGFVVAGYHLDPPGPTLDQWGVVVLLDGAGTVIGGTNFYAEGDISRFRDVLPINGGRDGYLLVGDKFRQNIDPLDPRIEWNLPWLWALRLDAELAKDWDVLHGKIGHDSRGFFVLPDGTGYLTGGQVYEAPGASASTAEWVMRLDASGTETASTNLWRGIDRGVFDAIPAPDGDWVLATGSGLLRVDDNLAPVWRAGTEPTAAVAPAGDGGFVGVGRNRLHKVTDAGEPAWSVTIGHGASDAGYDLAPTDDGGFMVVGSVQSRGHGGGDLWILKTDAAGERLWDMWLGGEGLDIAHAVAPAGDGFYVAVGSGTVDGIPILWVVKVDGNKQAPVPSFEYTPASPVFREQEMEFDASSSTAPGSSIVGYGWDFGDGTFESGEQATHSFVDSGLYTVTLCVTNADGIVDCASREIEVTGLVVQWERPLLYDDQDQLHGLIEARDGGFLVVGARNVGRFDAYLAKMDRRGRIQWETYHKHGRIDGDDVGRAVVPAPDGGYTIVGELLKYTNGFWNNLAFQLTVDEDGEPRWPSQAYGSSNRAVTAWAVTTTPDGGYLLGGAIEITGSVHRVRRPALIKTDAVGVEEWRRELEGLGTGELRAVVAAPDGYAAVANIGDGGSDPLSWVVRTDLAGAVIWSNEFTAARPGIVGRWLGWRDTPGGPLALAGRTRYDLSLTFLDETGAVTGGDGWSGTNTVQRWDIANHATRTPDGGYLLTGTWYLPNAGTSGQNYELALVKTDADGLLQWRERRPGTTNTHEYGVASLVLDDGSYVVLGSKDVWDRHSPGWLFRLAPNRRPVARMSPLPILARIGDEVEWDGSGSLDTDGTVDLLEWDFGDGSGIVTGAVVNHAFAEAGLYEVTLTAVDDDQGEDTVGRGIYILGIRVDDPTANVHHSSITNAPANDPIQYPRSGSPPGLDWGRAIGFELDLTPDTATTRFIRATFAEPIPEGSILYRLPDWTPMPYTRINDHTVEVSMYIYYWYYDLAFVLAPPPYPAPSLVRVKAATLPRWALTFGTETGWTYRIQQALELEPPGWSNLWFAPSPAAGLTEAQLPGTGSNETIYIEIPDANRWFWRPALEGPGD